MRFLPNRLITLPSSTEQVYSEWLHSIDSELENQDCDRNELCKRILTDIHYPTLTNKKPEDLSLSDKVLIANLDPRNVTLEPEYYADVDLQRYYRVKPLIWLWEMFDQSPLSENVDLGVKFRRMLAKRIFHKCGKNFKAFHYVKLSYGYNLEVGDDVIIHRHVLLDDRGGIKIGDGASVSDFANIYSHSHDIVEGRNIETPVTIIGDEVRITYHATVMSGVHMAEGTMLGSFGVATRNTEPHSVYAGIPARKIKDKPMNRRRNSSDS
ncbi:MAG: acyltransferase [Longimicrobiales bacterium]